MCPQPILLPSYGPVRHHTLRPSCPLNTSSPTYMPPISIVPESYPLHSNGNFGPDERRYITWSPCVLGTWYALLINSITLSRSHLQFSDYIGSVIALSLFSVRPLGSHFLFQGWFILYILPITLLWTGMKMGTRSPAARVLSVMAAAAGESVERERGNDLLQLGLDLPERRRDWRVKCEELSPQ